MTLRYITPILLNLVFVGNLNQSGIFIDCQRCQPLTGTLFALQCKDCISVLLRISYVKWFWLQPSATFIFGICVFNVFSNYLSPTLRHVRPGGDCWNPTLRVEHRTDSPVDPITSFSSPPNSKNAFRRIVEHSKIHADPTSTKRSNFKTKAWSKLQPRSFQFPCEKM